MPEDPTGIMRRNTPFGYSDLGHLDAVGSIAESGGERNLVSAAGQPRRSVSVRRWSAVCGSGPGRVRVAAGGPYQPRVKSRWRRCVPGSPRRSDQPSGVIRRMSSAAGSSSSAFEPRSLRGDTPPRMLDCSDRLHASEYAFGSSDLPAYERLRGRRGVSVVPLPRDPRGAGAAAVRAVAARADGAGPGPRLVTSAAVRDGLCGTGQMCNRTNILRAESAQSLKCRCTGVAFGRSSARSMPGASLTRTAALEGPPPWR